MFQKEDHQHGFTKYSIARSKEMLSSGALILSATESTKSFESSRTRGRYFPLCIGGSQMQ
jgi:hypothetical protein